MPVVNTRVLHGPPTGVQRYVSEILAAWPDSPPERITPPVALSRGLAGHAWEQFVLPARLRRSQLLWSPVHSGPLAWRNQVVTVHDVVPLDHPEWLNRRFARWYRFMLPRLVRRARHVIAISEFTRRRLIATCGLPVDRTSVIPCGVGEDFRPASAQAIEAARARLGLGRGRYLLALGSLEPRKNIPALLEAWQRARAQLPDDLVLVVAGAAGDPAVFGDAGLGAWPDGVLATGHIEDRDLPALYSGAEWSLCVSRYEGFGLTPLESMACGTPVIVSDIPVFNESVGEAGLRVDPHSPEAIAEGLRQALSGGGLRRELAARATERSARFCWRRSARATRDLLTRFA
ncbi:MAG: glycosyltransferase [Gammaproteobacteria bacterium]|jgi:glycosyltransferase involved in cell wall biosynthesis|nr:glycosyltransferase [Gammaproteobacteria bacterium]